MLLLLVGPVLRAESLATLTVTVPKAKETHTVFEVYERNKYDRIIARADCENEVSLAPDRYNIRIIEESKRGLREIWLYNIEAHGTVRLKAKFGSPTVRVRIIDNSSTGLPHTVLFRNRKNRKALYSLPLNIYTRLPTGRYTVEVLREKKVVSTSELTLERELDGTLTDKLKIEWIVD
jgi:hypothetical protein